MNDLTHHTTAGSQYSNCEGKYAHSFALRAEKNHLFVDIQGAEVAKARELAREYMATLHNNHAVKTSYH